MPKVLRIINRFNLGGPTFNAAYLTKYLAPEFETKLVGGSKDDSEDSSEFIVRNLGIEPVIVPEMKRSINLKNDFTAYKKIYQIIKEFKPDIVHTHASKAGTLGRIAAIRLNVPVIVHTFHGHVFHSYFGSAKTLLYKTIERYLSRKSTKIIAISELQKKELSEIHKICPPDKIDVIPLGFDLDRFRENTETKRIWFRKKFGLTQDTIAIGIIGRIVPIKNHSFFLSAIKNLKENTTKKFIAFIVGDGEDRIKLQNEAEAIGLSYSFEDCSNRFDLSLEPEPKHNNDVNIIFTSWIREVDIVYAGLDIVALTSYNEGTPVSLIEAQASSKPVISTNVGGIENVVEHGVSGLLTGVSVSLFSKKLLSLVDNEEQRITFGRNGVKSVFAKYNYNRLVKEISAMYYKLLETKQKGD
ncbi:MAG TPA: glycosyltransferase family 1 protein [Flavobacteriales bacterium]|nr:glycosyltransferase family 1 protein [Flavobacteriales bacterium]